MVYGDRRCSTISNEINQYFSGLLAALHNAEVEQKKIYDNAIDIENMEEATAVTFDARKKIQLLRKSIKELQHVHNEYLIVFPSEHGNISKENPDTAPNKPAVAVKKDNQININPKEFYLLGKSYSVNGWQEILVLLCEAMLLRKPYKFANISIASLTNISEQRVLSWEEQPITEQYAKLSNGLYVTTTGSPKEIKMRCEYILKACGYNSDELRIG